MGTNEDQREREREGFRRKEATEVEEDLPGIDH